MNHFKRLFQTNTTKRTPRILGRWLLIAGIAVSAVIPGYATADHKTVYVTTTTPSKLEFSFQPTSATVRAGQPITFNMRANQRVFLYVYARNPDGSTTLILPNHLQTQNQYNANQTTPVPNRDVEFIADGASAYETIYAVASTKYIDLNLTSHHRVGHFPVLSHSTMTRKFAEKGINLRETNNNRYASSVPQSSVKRVDISVAHAYSQQSTPLTPSDFGLPILPDQATHYHGNQTVYHSAPVTHIHRGQSSYMHSHQLDQIQHSHDNRQHTHGHGYAHRSVGTEQIEGTRLSFAN